jgi:hypothetical protein
MKKYPFLLCVFAYLLSFSGFMTATTVLIDNQTNCTLHVRQKDWTGVSMHSVPAHKEHALEAISGITCNIIKVESSLAGEKFPYKGDCLLDSITIQEFFPKAQRLGVAKSGSEGFGARIGWWAKFRVK